MNKICKIVLITLMVIGAVVCEFTDIPVAEYISIAVTFGAAGALCAATFNKSEKKDWKVYVSMTCIGVSSFGLGLLNVSTDTMTKVITAVVSVVILIIGVVFGSIVPKKNE